MLVRELRERPQSWLQYTKNTPLVAMPFHALEWILQDFAMVSLPAQ
jgi:hypothetical protein